MLDASATDTALVANPTPVTVGMAGVITTIPFADGPQPDKTNINSSPTMQSCFQTSRRRDCFISVVLQIPLPADPVVYHALLLPWALRFADPHPTGFGRRRNRNFHLAAFLEAVYLPAYVPPG
jgi:hypothetical protein